MTRLLLGAIWFGFVGIHNTVPPPKPVKNITVLRHFIDDTPPPGFGFGVYSYDAVCINGTDTMMMYTWRPQNGSPDTLYFPIKK